MNFEVMDCPGRRLAPTSLSTSALPSKMAPIRVAVGGLFHETNTYGFPHNPLTELKNFSTASGQHMIEAMRGGGYSTSGFVDYAEAHPDQFKLLPFTLALANPSGTISAACWASLRKTLLTSLKEVMTANGGVDCVALHLHGAGVSQDTDDLEGLLLADIRSMVGPDVVIVANLDLHAKFTKRMHENVDVINAVLTYPHIDHNPRSQQLLALVPGILSKKIKPVRYVERLPFMLVSGPVSSEISPIEFISSLFTNMRSFIFLAFFSDGAKPRLHHVGRPRNVRSHAERTWRARLLRTPRFPLFRHFRLRCPRVCDHGQQFAPSQGDCPENRLVYLEQTQGVDAQDY